MPYFTSATQESSIPHRARCTKVYHVTTCCAASPRNDTIQHTAYDSQPIALYCMQTWAQGNRPPQVASASVTPPSNPTWLQHLAADGLALTNLCCSKKCASTICILLIPTSTSAVRVSLSSALLDGDIRAYNNWSSAAVQHRHGKVCSHYAAAVYS